MKPQKVILIVLGLLAILLAGCQPAPKAVADSWVKALNAGNIDSALSYLAEDAVVTIIPAGPNGDGEYHGHDEIRGWYETMVAVKGSSTLSDCKENGDTLTCLDTYTDEGLKSMGVDFIEGEWVAILRDGKIQSYTVTMTPESLTKFPPPPSPTPTQPARREVRLTDAEAMAGIWEAKNGDFVVSHDFRANSTVIVTVIGVGRISSGPFTFEDDLLKFEDRAGDCAGLVGLYEVYGTYEGDQLVHLRFVLVGEDACTDRRNTLAGNILLPPNQ